MADIFELIPEEERPYRWAYLEMMLSVRNSKTETKPKHIRLGMEKLVIPFDMHVSLFHSDDPAMPDIYRAYWYSTDSVLYYTIANYQELREQHPEIVTLMENSGRNVYEHMISRVRAAIKEGVPIPDYPPLSIYRVRKEEEEKEED